MPHSGDYTTGVDFRCTSSEIGLSIGLDIPTIENRGPRDISNRLAASKRLDGVFRLIGLQPRP